MGYLKIPNLYKVRSACGDAEVSKETYGLLHSAAVGTWLVATLFSVLSSDWQWGVLASNAGFLSGFFWLRAPNHPGRRHE